MKATVAVLSFILSSAAKHSVDGESLSSELQQLGLPKGTGMRAGRWVTCGPRGARQRSGCVTLRCTLPSLGQEPETCPLSGLSPSTHLLAQGTSLRPPEHAASLCRCYEEKQSSLQEHLRACSLRGECGVPGWGLGSILEGACGLGGVGPQKGDLTTSHVEQSQSWDS